MASSVIKANEDKNGDGIKDYRAPSGAKVSALRTKPVSDLKAMFDNAGNKSSMSEQSANVTKTKLNVLSTKKIVTKPAGSSHVTSLNAEKAAYVKNGNSILAEDKCAFEALNLKLKTDGIEKLLLKPDPTDQVNVAISKTCNGGNTCKATVEPKQINCSSDYRDKTKTNAAFVISLGLTKLHTRPTITKDVKNISQDGLLDGTAEKKAVSVRSGISQSSSPGIKRNENYKVGVAKGWQGNVVNDKGSNSVDSKKPVGKFKESSIGKIREQVTTASDKKIPGFRSVSPLNISQNSSDESSGSSFGNLSPKGFKVNSSDGEAPTSKWEDKTDVNANVPKFENNGKMNILNVKSNSNGNSIDEVVKDSKSSASIVKQKDQDKDSLKFKRNFGSPIRDSESGRQSSKQDSDLKCIGKSRISLEESKRKSKSLDIDHETHRSLCRESSVSPKQSITKSSSLGIKHHLDKFDCTEQILAAQKNVERSLKTPSNIQEIKQNELLVLSNKLSTEKFQLLKKEFEIKKVSQTSTKNLEKADVKVGIGILERKQSFEKADIQKKKSQKQKANVSPREKSVTETIKTLNELDAKAKSEQIIVHRSLSSASQDDHVPSQTNDTQGMSENSSRLIHQEVSANRDFKNISDEDISSDISESGIIYEVIPGQDEKEKVVLKKAFTDGSRPFRKRKKTGEDQTKHAEFQTGTDGDIDSDTDSSSSSGIYEYIDPKPVQKDTSSDSDSLEDELAEVPPSRDSVKGKKKGFKDRLKRLYKGGTMDMETGLKQVTGTGMPLSPQSGMTIMKNLRKAQTGSGSNLDTISNDNTTIINSQAPDTDNDTEQNSKKSDPEKLDEVSGEAIPPPLPPRHSGMNRTASGGEMFKQSNASESLSYLGVPPSETVPRTSSNPNLDSKSGRSSPLPLPPRNRITNKLDINVVIPVHPGGDRKSAQAQSADMSYMNDTTSPRNIDCGPPLPQRPNTAARKSNSNVDSSVHLVEKVPSPASNNVIRAHNYEEIEKDYSLADEIRKELEKFPTSSSYIINSQDLSAVPSPGVGKLGKAPIEEVLHFYSQYEEDCPYMDLSDDQVYGTGQRYTSKLESSSLYQFYNKDKITRASRRNATHTSFEESDEEDDERVYEDLSSYSSGHKNIDTEKKADEVDKLAKKMSLEMFGKTGTVLRSLWSEMPEVKNSGILASITPHERKLQESMFEILTSEATYLKSLNVLIDIFLLSDEFGCKVSSSKCVITKLQQHVIFSNIGLIRDTSERFLSKLESRWQESVQLSDVCDIIAEFSARDFECYVHYCSNQVFQDRAVTDLRKKPEFAETLKRIEAKPECQGLPMISFLLLPMQRITRLPLLVDAISRRLDPGTDKQRHMSALNAFHALSKVVKRCNNGAKKMQQTEQMFFISKQIEFSTNKDIAQIPLLSGSRYLVKQGELVRITNENGSRMPFGKAKHGKQTVHMFLFSDLLVITKKKGDKFVVTDHAQRNSLHVEELDSPDMIARVLPLGVPSGCKYLFLLVMLENHDKKQVDNVFACNSVSDRTRWVDAFTPVKVTDDQRIYEEWDCPQVLCIKKYVAREPDELSLDESDVVNVYKKLEDDGLYEGERLHDGERGWFPKDHTVEIENAHVRARNKRINYRLQNAAEMGRKP